MCVRKRIYMELDAIDMKNSRCIYTEILPVADSTRYEYPVFSWRTAANSGLPRGTERSRRPTFNKACVGREAGHTRQVQRLVQRRSSHPRESLAVTTLFKHRFIYALCWKKIDAPVPVCTTSLDSTAAVQCSKT